MQMKGWLIIQFVLVFGEKTVSNYRRNWDEVDLLILNAIVCVLDVLPVLGLKKIEKHNPVLLSLNLIVIMIHCNSALTNSKSAAHPLQNNSHSHEQQVQSIGFRN